jgi:hypothetical protein
MQLWQAMPRHTNFGLPELIQALYDEDENGVLHLRHALFVDVDPTIKVRAVLADFELVRDTWAAAVEEMAGTTESWQAKEMHGLWVKVCDAISAALA